MGAFEVILLLGCLCLWAVVTAVFVRAWELERPVFVRFVDHEPAAWYAYVAATGVLWGIALGALARWATR